VMIHFKSSTPVQENLLKRIKSRNWLESNLKEIQEKYAEKWIAIVGEKVIADGNNPDEVKQKISGKFLAAEMILIRIPTGAISQPV